MQATEGLQHDHELIEDVLNAIAAQAEQVDRTGQVNTEFFHRALDFLKGFADACHHGKEEGILFPTLEDKGMPGESGPIGVMLADHEQGRGHLRAMTQALRDYQAGDTQAGARLDEEARAYAVLMHAHIQKENMVLFPMGEEILADAEKQDVVTRMNDFEEKIVGAGVHERYHALAHDLVRLAGAEEPKHAH